MFFECPRVTSTIQQCSRNCKGVGVASCYKEDKHEFTWVVSWELIPGMQQKSSLSQLEQLEDKAWRSTSKLDCVPQGMRAGSGHPGHGCDCRGLLALPVTPCWVQQHPSLLLVSLTALGSDPRGCQLLAQAHGKLALGSTHTPYRKSTPG